jgi:phosphoserine phosphatase
MTHVATLISHPEARTLTQAALDAVHALLPCPGTAQWLDPAVAADIPFAPDQNLDERGLSAQLRAVLAPHALDVVVQRAARRRKRLFLADMDSTMIGQECIDELADFAGLKTEVAAITEAAMRGDLAFEAALRSRVALLKRLPAEVIGKVLADRIRLTPGARALVRTMRQNGAYACLVSGGFRSFTDPIAAMIGFDENRSNTLLLDGTGVLAGTVAEPIFGRNGKREALIELTARLGLQADETLAVGDGANDLTMIQAAGLGVAFHAKPLVKAAATASIDHGDLTALLYAQGYRRSEFVAD